MRVVFMGTPDFALYSLDALCRSEHEVAAVVTQPDRPGNRGAVIFSPVKKYALEHGIPVLQYEKIRTEGISDLKKLNADIYITAAYGQILSREILNLPLYGIINVHASLLPKYRGSSPIQWALINGERETGVTVMQTAEGLDTGDILLQKSVKISPDDTAGTLFNKLGVLGASALLEYLEILESGEKITPIKQNDSEASYYPMLKKTDGAIDWSLTADEICNRVRGVTPWPGAYTHLGSKMLKVFGAKPCDLYGDKCGEILKADKTGIVVACGKTSVSLKELQIEGKRRMSCADFINGNKLSAGEILE